MHGDAECRGNVQQLCVQAHIPPGTPKSLASDASPDDSKAFIGNKHPTLAFIQAQNYFDPHQIGSDAYARKSLESIGHSWTESGVEHCVSGVENSQDDDNSDDQSIGKEGKTLLRNSIKRTSNELNAKKSCTILLQGKVRCVHDGSWYDCDVSFDQLAH